MATFNSGGTPWKLIALGTLLFVWILSSLKLHNNQSVIVDTTQNEALKDEVTMDTKPHDYAANFIVLGHDGGEYVPGVASQLNKDETRPLLLYTYAESDNTRANFEYFIAKGIHDAADCLFLFDGETNATELLPYESNIKIIQRENKCFDLGTIGEVLRKDDLWKNHKRFITLNASIRGPFLPIYASSSCWTDVFLGRVTEKVKLVGISFNCIPRPHLQSMLFATDDVGMGILLDPTIANSASTDDFWGTKEDPVGFTQCYETLKLAVNAEVWNHGAHKITRI